jgi:uncharacterized protein VirK/YbjX
MKKGILRTQIRPAGWRLAPARPAPQRAQAYPLARQYLRVCAFARDPEAPLPVRLAMILRSARVFLYPRTHRELLRLGVYRDYVVPAAGPDLFHHLSRRFYLAQGLSLRQRVQAMLDHHRFEDASFDAGYKLQVYRDGGLLLWSREVDGKLFSIRLALGYRYAAEGDLSVSLLVGSERLHSLSFSWVGPGVSGMAEPVALFVTANQGRWRKDHEFLDSFNQAFPQSSPSYVCYAALQGLARAVGAAQMRTVPSRLQVCCVADKAESFTQVYDTFWEAVGGTRMASGAFLLPVPQPLKPLAEVAAKHRKRTAVRRALLQEVSDSARQVVASHFHGAPLSAS